MPVDGVSSSDTINFLSPKGKETSGTAVDSDTFLKLLVAQLQYQNPLEPQSDTQFVTQLSQMSTMEQLQAMKNSMTSSQAYGMIGNYAYAEVLNSETGVTECYLGLVNSVIIKDGVNYVLVDNTAIPVNKVTRVISPEVFEAQNSGTAAETQKTEAAAGGEGTGTAQENAET